MTPIFTLAAPGEFFCGFFGFGAAILFVGGGIFLRWQRSRQQFLLTRAALERGMTALPGGMPVWLVSMRQGVMLMVLGLGLILAGAAVVRSSRLLNMPPELAAQTQPFAAAASTQAASQAAPAAPEPARPQGMLERWRTAASSNNPELEYWRHQQAQRAVGGAAVCAGGILVLLGLARIIFSRIEKRYLEQPATLPHAP